MADPSSPRGRKQDELLLAHLRRSGDIAIRERLCERHLPLARELVRRYEPSRDLAGDLIHVARVGLIKAIDGYRPGQSCSFTGFATQAILSELRRFEDLDLAARTPRIAQERALRISHTAEILEAESDGPATVPAIAARCSLSEDELLEIIVREQMRDDSATPPA